MNEYVDEPAVGFQQYLRPTQAHGLPTSRAAGICYREHTLLYAHRIFDVTMKNLSLSGTGEE